MPGAYLWGWYPEGNKHVKLRVDVDGSIHVVGYVDSLDDIGDVDLTGIADDDVIYWDAAAGKWKPIAHLGLADAHHNQSHTLASHSTKPHSALTDVTAAQHHAKYLNTEAVSAVEAAGLALADGKNIKVISALTADHTFAGLTALMTAGEILDFGWAIYIRDTSKGWAADADDVTMMPVVALAAASLAADAVGEFLLQGFIRHNEWDWTPGGLLYASLTAGFLTQDVSGYTTGDQVQVVGVAITADIIYFNPSLELVEIS